MNISVVLLLISNILLAITSSVLVYNLSKKEEEYDNIIANQEEEIQNLVADLNSYISKYNNLNKKLDESLETIERLKIKIQVVPENKAKNSKKEVK